MLRLGSFCPFGSALPTSLRVGYYAVDVNGDHTIEKGVNETACPVLHRCSGGDKHECESNTIPNAESSVCVPCPVGKYRDLDMTSCSPCPGSSFSGGGGSSCETCPANEIANEAKSACIPCKPCAVGSGQIAPCTTETDTQCEKCSANEYSTGGDSKCVACGDNEVSTEEKSACVPCPVGEYRDGALMASCEPCPGNSFSGGGGSSCETCSANEIANEAKSACIPCKPCAVGSGQIAPCTTETDTQCEQCSANEYSTGSDSKCVACGDNEVSTEERSACVPCPVGEYRDGALMASCEPCLGNSFSGGGGSSCESCPANEIANEAKSACGPCPSGTYRNTTMVKCEMCLAGSFCPGGDIIPCDGVKFEGKYCPARSFAAIDCAAGSFCPNTFTNTTCREGFYCPAASIAEINCPKGHQCPTAGMQKPSPCPKGSHQQNAMQTECITCGEGEYQDQEGATTCQDCEAGYFCTAGASQQTPCPAGTFCAAKLGLPTSLSSGHFAVNGTGHFTEVGGHDEEACQPGWHCSGGNRTECEIGTYCEVGSPAEVDCAAGYFCKTPEEQTACAAGKYCPKGSSKETECPDGATCTVPASPELVIQFGAALEKRESEVAKDPTALWYNLSLSVKPASSVKVEVAHKPGAKANCVTYGDGLLLRNTQFSFDATNWDVPQMVNITMKREPSFQGNTITQFVHSVTSNDTDWQSPFLRPMTVTIADDDDCTEGAQKYDVVVSGKTIRKCGCSEGYFVEKTDPKYCGSVTTCAECEPGMVCTAEDQSWLSKDSTLEQLLIAPGYFRIAADSTAVIECPVHEACDTTNPALRSAGNYLCNQTLGHEGEFLPSDPRPFEVSDTTPRTIHVFLQRLSAPSPPLLPKK